NNALDDVETFSGGYELRATVLPTSSLEDPDAEIAAADGIGPTAIQQVVPQSIVPIEARQVGTGQEFEAFPLLGFGQSFLAAQPYELALRAYGYESDEAVWEAVERETGLAIVTSLIVPTRVGLSV